MKTTHILALTLVFALLAFGQAGCKRGGQQDTGTQGIVLEQVSGAPPTQVSKGQDFRFMVTLENKGSYDVKPGEAQVFLGGFFPELFSTSQADLVKLNTVELKKAIRASGVSGGRENIVFASNARYVGQNVNYDQKISYKSCYVYESDVRADICFAFENSQVCSLSAGEKDKEGKLAGATIGDAPLQITSITEERSGQNVQIKFVVENKGSGKIYAPTANCATPEPFLENAFLAQIETEEPLDCRPTLSGEKSGEGRVASTILCKRNMQGAEEHESPIRFRLRYKYVETSEAMLKVTE